MYCCVLCLKGRDARWGLTHAEVLAWWLALCLPTLPTRPAGFCLSLARRPFTPLPPGWLQFVDRYVSVAAGPAKWSKLVEFLRTTYPRITADLVNRQQNQVGASAHTHCRSFELSDVVYSSLHLFADQYQSQLKLLLSGQVAIPQPIPLPSLPVVRRGAG